MRVPYFSLLSLSCLLMVAGCGATSTGQATTQTPSPQAAVTATPTPTLEPGQSTGLISMYMVDAVTGWAQGFVSNVWQVLRTNDGAADWQNVTPPALSDLHGQVTAYYLNGSTAWIVDQEATTVVYQTTNGGQTWQQRGSLNPHSLVSQLLFINSQDGWMLDKGGATGNEFADLYRTTDGGASWAEAATTNAPPNTAGTIPFNGTSKSISFLNASTGWMAAFSNAAGFWLYVTHDGGVTWQQQTLPTPPGASAVQSEVRPPTFFDASDGIMPVQVFGADAGSLDVYVTHNGGVSWQSTSLVQANDRIVDFLDMNHGWATDGTTLFSTSDGGYHWQSLPASSVFHDVIILDFVTSVTGWAISQTDSGALALMKTTDGGQTWAAISLAQ